MLSALSMQTLALLAWNMETPGASSPVPQLIGSWFLLLACCSQSHGAALQTPQQPHAAERGGGAATANVPPPSKCLS